jgi:hypothetical protein
MNLRPLAALAVTALIGIGSSATPASAQEYQGCFLLDESRSISRSFVHVQQTCSCLSAIALPLVVPVRIQLLRLNRAGKAVLPHLIAVQDTTTDLDRRALIVMAASILLEGPISLVTAA